MSTTIFGKAAIFFLSVEWWMYRCALGTSLGSRLLRQKLQRSLPERQTERKNRCLRLPRHTGHPQLKYGKASATTAWKTKWTRTPSLVSPYEKTGDSRFAPNLLPYTGVRAVFFGVTCAVVRKVYGRAFDCRSSGPQFNFESGLVLFFLSQFAVGDLLASFFFLLLVSFFQVCPGVKRSHLTFFCLFRVLLD